MLNINEPTHGYERNIKKNNTISVSKIGILLFLILILTFPISALQGAKQGLLLWFHTVLPTLLPFIILSNLIIRLKITNYLSKLLYPIFHFLFGVSYGGCYPVLIGFLSGIPVGAKSVAELVKDKSISLKEGQFLLGLCNNASPMFIMSYIAISQLKLPNLRYILLAILYGSAIVASILYFKLLDKLPNLFKKPYDSSLSIMNYEPNENSYNKRFDFSLLDSSIMDGFEVITKVGGYIILFSIPAKIITDLFSGDNVFILFLIGILEITTGINSLSESVLNQETKIVLITMLTAFGGLSGLAQTKSVINDTRLLLGTYIKVKLLQMLIAFIIIFAYVKLFLA